MSNEHIPGFYFGRFQPPLIKHANIIADILGNHPNVNLIVGVADAPLEQSQSNFLYGEEVQKLFFETLASLGISGVDVQRVPILPHIPFAESIRRFLDIHTSEVDDAIKVFSGSPSTINACEEVGQQRPVEIVHLADDDITGPRARHIREALIEGYEVTSNTGLVVPSVATYLNSQIIRTRIKALPSGKKRPWAAIATG